jgi:membrane protease YdiL (CAAX protease family)
MVITFVFLFSQVLIALFTQLGRIQFLLVATAVGELGILLLPAVLFMRRHEGLGHFGVAPACKHGEVLWAALLGVGIFFLSTGINSFLQVLWDALGVPTTNVSDAIYLGGGWEILIAIFAIVLVPAVAEEFLFRGAILFSWLPGKRTSAIIHTTLFFALLHCNPTALPVYCMIGIFLGNMAVLSDSIMPPIVLHGVFNLLGVLVSYAAVPAQAARAAAEPIGGSYFIFAGVLYGIIGLFISYPSYRAFKCAVARTIAADKMAYSIRLSGQKCEGLREFALMTGVSTGTNADLRHDDSNQNDADEKQRPVIHNPLTVSINKGTSKAPVILTYVTLILANAIMLLLPYMVE